MMRMLFLNLNFLDPLAYRNVSDEIAQKYGVTHESPQAILIKEGKAVFNASHIGISFDELNSDSTQS